MTLRWTERAAEHLQMLHAYIAEDNPAAADKLIDRVLEAAERLIEFPHNGEAGQSRRNQGACAARNANPARIPGP